MKFNKPWIIGLTVFVVLMLLTSAIVYILKTTSELYIRNGSGSDVYLTEIRHGGARTFEGQGRLLRASDGTTFIAFHGAASEEQLEMKVRLGQEERILSCSIDNRNRPCEFTVGISKDGLYCGPCERPLGLIVPAFFGG